MGATSSSRRERKKEEVHDAILEAALSLFEANGYSATTVDDIAERADIAPRTFFRYFTDKAATLRPSSATHLDTFARALEETPTQEPLLPTVQRALRVTLEGFSKDRARVVRKHRIATEAGLERAADDFADLWNAVESIIARRLDTSAETDPRPALVTGLAIAAAEASMRAWLHDGAREDLGVLVDGCFEHLRRLIIGPETLD